MKTYNISRSPQLLNLLDYFSFVFSYDITEVSLKYLRHWHFKLLIGLLCKKLKNCTVRMRSLVCSAEILALNFRLKALFLICLIFLLSVIKKAYIHVLYYVDLCNKSWDKQIVSTEFAIVYLGIYFDAQCAPVKKNNVNIKKAIE